MLNTIYVTSEGAWLRKDGANLVVDVDGVERGRAPLHMLDGVVSFGRPGASPALLAACAEAGITVRISIRMVAFLPASKGPAPAMCSFGAQFRAADAPAKTVPIVRGIVAAKAANQRTVIRRALRDHGGTLPADEREVLEAAERRLTDVARRTVVASNVDLLRGLEGEAAQAYFGAFGLLLRSDNPAFAFHGRSRRPPLDRVNALLSFFYDARPRLPFGTGSPWAGSAGGLST